MTYAFLTDGMDFERREQFDLALNKGPEKVQARRERAAAASLVGLPGAIVMGPPRA